MGSGTGRRSDTDVHTPLNISGEGAHPTVAGGAEDIYIYPTLGDTHLEVDTTPTPLRLDVGNRYLDRCGNVVTIKSSGGCRAYPYEGYSDTLFTQYYTSDGRWRTESPGHDFDLITECVGSELSTDPVEQGGTKHDTDKSRIDLIDPDFLETVGKVLGFGMRKYAAHNWRQGMSWSRVIAAAYRHLGAINRGEDIDPESGLPHTGHLACCTMFLDWYRMNRKEYDDRYKHTDSED